MRPTDIARQPFDGDVFNFSVDEDESYVAEGFLVHNCRCALIAWRADWDEHAPPARPGGDRAAPPAPEPPPPAPERIVAPVAEPVRVATEERGTGPGPGAASPPTREPIYAGTAPWRSASMQGPGDELVPADFLERSVAALRKLGIPVQQDEDGDRFLKNRQAAAIYFVDQMETGVGTIILPRTGPTRAAYIEELLHLGQHRKRRFVPVADQDIFRMEIAAQERLLNIGRRLGWTSDDLDRVRRAKVYWEKRLAVHIANEMDKG